MTLAAPIHETLSTTGDGAEERLRRVIDAALHAARVAGDGGFGGVIGWLRGRLRAVASAHPDLKPEDLGELFLKAARRHVRGNGAEGKS